MEHPDSIRNDTDSQTLHRLVISRTHDMELTILLNAIQTACKLISRSVRKAGIAGLCKYCSRYPLSAIQYESRVHVVMSLRWTRWFRKYHGRRAKEARCVV